MNTGRRRCPCCWRLVHRTINGAIEGHWDGTGKSVCPGSSNPYRITVGPKPKKEAA